MPLTGEKCAACQRRRGQRTWKASHPARRQRRFAEWVSTCHKHPRHDRAPRQHVTSAPGFYPSGDCAGGLASRQRRSSREWGQVCARWPHTARTSKAIIRHARAHAGRSDATGDPANPRGASASSHSCPSVFIKLGQMGDRASMHASCRSLNTLIDRPASLLAA